MENFKTKDYKIFEMFDKDWGLVTAGTMECHNSCTISWGSLGNIWGDGEKFANRDSLHPPSEAHKRIFK